MPAKIDSLNCTHCSLELITKQLEENGQITVTNHYHMAIKILGEKKPGTVEGWGSILCPGCGEETIVDLANLSFLFKT